MLNTTPSKPDRAALTLRTPFTARFLALWNFPALNHLPIRASLAFVLFGACLIRAYVGLWGSRIYTHDTFTMLDGALRVINGQRPHVDFYTGLGPVAYLITAIGVAIASGNAAGLAYGQALFGCVAGLWTYMLCDRRLRGMATILACITVVLMAVVPTTIGEAPSATTGAMTYNRYGYALVALTMIEAIASRRSSRGRDELWGGISTGVVLGVVVFLKISFVMGAGFLLLTLMPLKKQTRARWVGMAAALVVTVLAFALYLRFDLRSVYDDLQTVAHSKHVMVGWYLAKDALVNGAPFLLFVHLISQSTGSTADKNAIRIAGLGVCLTGFFLLLTSWQFYGLPLDSIMAVLLLDRVLPESAGVTQVPALRFSMLLFGSFVAFTYLATEGTALQYALSQKLSEAPHTNFTASSLAGFNSTTEHDYVEYVNEGCDLVNRHRGPQDSVFSLDFTNPFSFALGMKPASGGTTWLQYHTNFDEAGPSPERLFGDASLVMLPKVYSDPSLPDTVPRIYGPYLKSHYAVAAESLNWWLYRRNDKENASLRELSKASVATSR